MKKSKKVLIFGVITIIIILGITIGLTYAFFTASVEGNQNANQTVITTADLRLVFNDTDILSLNNALPGVSNSKTFTVTNIGNVRQRYDINITNVINEFVGDELVYTITSDNEDGGEVLETPMPTEESSLLTSSINPGVTITYTITVKFKETGSSQDYNQGAQFSGKLQIVPRIMGVALGGYVYDESDNPLTNVTVELNSDPIITTTDEEGYYEIADAPIGNHTLYIKQGETVLGSKEITLLSSEESQIKDNNTIYLPDKVQAYLNIKLESELNIYLKEKEVALKWNRNFGGTGSDLFNSVIETDDGYIAVGSSASRDGDLNGIINTGASGTIDAIIVKYKINGEIEWVRNFGGKYKDEFNGILKVTDGYIAVGATYSVGGVADAIIVKYDKEGNVQWNESYGGGHSDYFKEVIEIDDGYITIGDSLSSNGDLEGLNKGGQDAIIVKYDASGNVVWKKNFGGSSSDIFNRVIKVSDGYIATGRSASGNGDLAEKIQKGGGDAIIVKYNFNGEILWVKNFGSLAADEFYGVTEASDGYIAVGYSGYFNYGDLTGVIGKGGVDAVIVKYDFNGEILWVKNFGGSGTDEFNEVTEISDGYIAVGHSNSSDSDMAGISRGSSDAIAIKYGTNGSVIWKKNFGGSSSEKLLKILKISNGYIIAGYSESTDGDFADLNKGVRDAIILNFSK